MATTKISESTFEVLTGEVIKLLEGGYFHPDMFLDGRLSASDYETYKLSGETMFGLDRFAGHELFYSTGRMGTSVRDDLQFIYSGIYKYKTPEAAEFWQTIDNANARKLWKWNYTGGNLRQRLTKLAAQIMYPYFVHYSDVYFSDKAREIVYNSAELIMNFSYSVWNGAGFFRHYATLVNVAVDKGVINPTTLNNLVLDARISGSTYRLPRSGKVLRDYFNSPSFVAIKKNSGSLKNITGLLIFGIFSIFLIINGLKKRN